MVISSFFTVPFAIGVEYLEQREIIAAPWEPRYPNRLLLPVP
jgi:hypothetical protein